MLAAEEGEREQERIEGCGQGRPERRHEEISPGMVRRQVAQKVGLISGEGRGGLVQAGGDLAVGNAEQGQRESQRQQQTNDAGAELPPAARRRCRLHKD